MRCRQVRPLLAAFADEAPEGELAVHLAGCARCSADLEVYRDLVTSLSALEVVDEEPSPDYLDRMLLQVPVPRITERVRLLAHARALRYALASVGGVALGAGAIGLVWWRTHRSVRGSTGGPEIAVSNAA